MPDNTITVFGSKIFGLNKLYRLIIDKDKIYGVYLANQLTSYDSLEKAIDFVFSMLVLITFNTLFISSNLNTTWEVVKYIFIFIIFILAGRQISNYFLDNLLVILEKSVNLSTFILISFI